MGTLTGLQIRRSKTWPSVLVCGDVLAPSMTLNKTLAQVTYCRGLKSYQHYGFIRVHIHDIVTVSSTSNIPQTDMRHNTTLIQGLVSLKLLVGIPYKPPFELLLSRSFDHINLPKAAAACVSEAEAPTLKQGFGNLREPCGDTYQSVNVPCQPWAAPQKDSITNRSSSCSMRKFNPTNLSAYGTCLFLCFRIPP